MVRKVGEQFQLTKRESKVYMAALLGHVTLKIVWKKSKLMVSGFDEYGTSKTDNVDMTQQQRYCMGDDDVDDTIVALLNRRLLKVYIAALALPRDDTVTFEPGVNAWRLMK